MPVPIDPRAAAAQEAARHRAEQAATLAEARRQAAWAYQQRQRAAWEAQHPQQGASTPTIAPGQPWLNYSGGGGGGGNNTPAPPSWAVPGAPGQYNWLPWADWQQTPWANVPTANAQEQQAWMNVMLPWQQAQTQQQQWGQEFDWRKAADQWNQQFQTGQFDWQKQQDALNQALAQRQLEEQARGVNMQTFGRRWQPNTRWM